MGNLRSQSQNYQRIMPVVRGRDNHPQCWKLKTNVLLFLLWVFQLSCPLRIPWPLSPTGICYELFCLFCWFWSFFIALVQYSPERGSNTFSIGRRCLSHVVYQVCKVCFDERVSFWGDLKGALLSVYLIRKRLAVALRAETVLINLQPFWLLSLLDESWPPTPGFVNIKSLQSNQQNFGVNLT